VAGGEFHAVAVAGPMLCKSAAMIYNLTQFLREWVYSLWLLRPLRVFEWVEFRAVIAVIVAFALVALSGKRVIRLLIRMKIGDAPEFDHADLNRITRQKANTPTMGGVLISCAILITVCLLADMTNFYVHMGLVCLVWLAVLGGLDDWLKLTSARRAPGSRQGLYTWEKFIIQVGTALVLGFFIYQHGYNNPPTRLLALPFQRTIDPHTMQPTEGLIYLGPWAFGILAVMVIVGSSNAVNLTDGMDGLASGIMAIVSFAFMVLCLIIGSDAAAPYLLMPHIPGSAELAVISGAMLGACLGFLWYNCHPAQVFMGDTGSLPLGGLIGYIAVVTRQEVLLVIIGGVLVAETLSVILQVGYFRLSRGSRLFRCAPMHHHFHLGGWSEQQVVVRFWLISALLAALALATIKLR
jgi:phospho-N-acetylmuramoyl-pentapeptide-transferase